MNEMKRWMILVEALLNQRPMSPRFLHQLTADTEENRKYLDDLERHQKQIEWEEQNNYEYPLDILSPPDFEDTKAWNAYWDAKEYEWDKFKKQHADKKRVEMQKQADAYQAQVDGIRLAAKDAMDDMIDKDREVVSKLAKQAINSKQQQSKKVHKQAMRPLKK